MGNPMARGESTRSSGRRVTASTSRVDPDVLAKVGLFGGLSADELDGLASLMRPRAYAKDEVIYLKGDPGTAFYVIASGRVKIALTSPDGKEIIIRRLGPGDFHGELALLDDQPRSADAIATEQSVLLVLQRDGFRHFIEEHCDAAVKLLGTVSQYLRRNADLIQDATFLKCQGRSPIQPSQVVSLPAGDSLLLILFFGVELAWFDIIGYVALRDIAPMH